MSDSCPYYNSIPKDFDKNLEYRNKVLSKAGKDSGFAAACKKMCSQDILFYINVFCWTYNPKKQDCPTLPFITYEYQDEAILEFKDAIENGYNLAWPKSREMGATWMGLTVMEWFWHFKRDLVFLIGSRNQDYVDKKGNFKSLFAKIDFLHKYQPHWLLPKGRWKGWGDPNRVLLHLGNEETGSSIDGESTTSEFGRADRRTAIFLDEFAYHDTQAGYDVLKSIFSVTDTVLFNSTPDGANNAFYDVVHNSGAKITKFWWWEHPEKNNGLYTSKNNGNGEYELEIIDEDFEDTVRVQRKKWEAPRKLEFPDDYPFILDGKKRSPWFDNKCNELLGAKEIAQELEISFHGSDYQFFDPQFIDKLIMRNCKEPDSQGEITLGEGGRVVESYEFRKRGKMKLWFNIRTNSKFFSGKPEFIGNKKFGIGADVSMGTGTSNSVISIVNLENGHKVGLWIDANTPVREMADIAVSLCRWFNNAKLIWDATGAPGKIFTKRVIDSGYSNLYYRKDDTSRTGGFSDRPGYYINSAEDKSVLLKEYRSSLADKTFINPSTSGMEETKSFVYQEGGGVEHSSALNTQDPSGAKKAHGDEVIADALVCRLKAVSFDDLEAPDPDVPYLSPAWMLREYGSKEEKESDFYPVSDW